MKSQNILFVKFLLYTQFELKKTNIILKKG